MCLCVRGDGSGVTTDTGATLSSAHTDLIAGE